jgi:hypothetical protein
MSALFSPTLDIPVISNERIVAGQQRFASTPTILWGFFVA